MGVDDRISPRNFSNSAQLGDERGVDQGSSTMPLGGFDNPPLYDMPDIKFDALDDCIKQDHLVLSHRGQMKVGFKLGTKKIIPNLCNRLQGLHLKSRHLKCRRMACPYTLSPHEGSHELLVV